MKKTHRKIIIITLIKVALLNLAAWAAPFLNSRFGIYNWCDWYAEHINPVIVNVFARFSNLFPISVGEIMIVAGIVIVAAFFVMSILYIFLRKKEFYKKVYRVYRLIVIYIVLAVCLVMTFNCTIYYHCSELDANENAEPREYYISEITELRNYIVKQCNYYSTVMERDENGYIVYDGDMQEASREAMLNLSEKYPRLAGYYPDVKHMTFSDLMSQSYMAGYYFPFSMEANCNGNMYIMNYPATYCHELSHLHGYIYEDEANFIAYLACIESDDDFIKYAGYLSVLNYVNNAFYESIGGDAEVYSSNVKISSQVNDDNAFLLPETWEEVEEGAVVSTETMDKVSDAFTEASLNLNGVSEGLAAYSGVTELLLEYYDGVLY